MARRHQLQQLQRELRRKEQELANISEVSERWRATTTARLAEAQILGLGKQDPNPPSYETTLDLLRQIAASPKPDLNLTTQTLSEGVEELNRLNAEEDGLSEGLARLRKRLSEMEELKTSSAAYRGALRLDATACR